MAPDRSARDGTRDALTAAGRGTREAQREEADELAAARRVLRKAEAEHDDTVARAEREVERAQTPVTLARAGRRLVLYDDRLTTPHAEHELTGSVTAGVRDADRSRHRSGHGLVIEGPGWTETVKVRRGEDAKLRRLAEQIEAAARDVGAVRDRRRAEVLAAEASLEDARACRSDVQEARSLVGKLDGLLDDREQVLDLAPGVSAGHDGVLVATDQRLLFVAWRRTLSLAYADISSVTARGKRFARLTVATAAGKHVFAGLGPIRTAEFLDVVGRRASGSGK